jgi:hypothetical protein
MSMNHGMDALLVNDRPTLCGVCARWGQGEWLTSGVRNPRTGETPHDNFVCHVCQDQVREWRELRQRCGRVEFDSAGEREAEARFRATARCKVEAWQMPPGKGFPA